MDIHAVQKTYRRYARCYDLYFGAVFQPGRRTVIKTMNCQPGDQILEVGVGTGLSLPLYPPDVSVTGIDISPDMLGRAQLRKVRDGLDNVAELRVMDAQQMEFASHSFDKVVAMYVASVVPDPALLVSEMRRVCKPGGELFFVNHFHSPNPVLGTMERLLTPFSKLMGFRPDLSLDSFIRETDLDVMESNRANLFGYWRFLRARNTKA